MQFTIAGLYNLIQNYKGDLCINSKDCKKNLNNYLSIVNRVDCENYEDDYILDILYLVSAIMQLVFL